MIFDREKRSYRGPTSGSYCCVIRIYPHVFWKGKKKSIQEVLFTAKNFVINHATLVASIPWAFRVL